VPEAYDTSWVNDLTGENLLAVCDVLLDIKQEGQFGRDVTIPLLPAINL